MYELWNAEPGRSAVLPECGAALELRCTACGAENEPEARFCGGCGTPLTAGGAAVEAVASAMPERPAPTAERRLVSVLFADLVVFTSLTSVIPRTYGICSRATSTSRGGSSLATAGRSRSSSATP